MKQDLYLIIPPELKSERILDCFDRFCANEKPQAVLYDLTDRPESVSQRVVRTIQSNGTAVIIKDNVEKTLALQADGVQIAYGVEIKKIKKQIGDLALGVVCTTRDEAMRAGEAGADYIGFDGNDAAVLTQWWSELFTLPCVDFNRNCPSEAADFCVRTLCD